MAGMTSLDVIIHMLSATHIIRKRGYGCFSDIHACTHAGWLEAKRYHYRDNLKDELVKQGFFLFFLFWTLEKKKIKNQTHPYPLPPPKKGFNLKKKNKNQSSKSKLESFQFFFFIIIINY